MSRLPAMVVGSALVAISTLAWFRVPILPEIGTDLALTPTELGGITMAFALGRLATDLPAGALADRLSPTMLYVGAGLLMGVGSTVLAVADSSATAWAGAFVIGSASSVANTTGMIYFSRSVGREARGRSMAVFSSGLLVGQTAGPAIAGGIAAAADWRAAQATAAAMGVLIALGFVGLIVAHPRSLAALLVPTEAVREAPVAHATGRPPRVELLVIYGTTFSVFFTLAAVPQTLIPLIGADDFGLGPGAIGLGLGLGGICRLVGAVTGGQVSDRAGRKAALVPGMALMTAGVTVLALFGGLASWLAAIVLTSLGSIGVSVSATMLGDHSGGGNSGRHFGRYRLVGDTGLLIGPLVATGLYSASGREAPLLVNATLLALATVACVLVLSETNPRG